MAKAAPTDHIGRRVKLRELYILSAVVERGSMAKAATYLTMSQPAVSEAIASLEETLKVRLLDRGSRGIQPTIYAQALLRRSTVVFDELSQGLRDIEYLADPATGEVRIGCPKSLAAGFVPAMIDEFSRRHPQVTFHVTDANIAALEFRELRERKVHLMLGRVPTACADDEIDSETSSTTGSWSLPAGKAGGSAPHDRARGTGERTVDTCAAKQSGPRAVQRSISRPWIERRPQR